MHDPVFGGTIRQNAEQHSPGPILTDSGCNQEVIAIRKQSDFSLTQVHINEQIGHNVGTCLLYWPQFGIAISKTRIGWGWWSNLFLFRKLIQDNRSRVNLSEHGSPYIWRMFFIVVHLRMAVYLEIHLITVNPITQYLGNYNQPLRPPEWSGLHWEITYHQWRTSFSSL